MYHTSGRTLDLYIRTTVASLCVPVILVVGCAEQRRDGIEIKPTEVLVIIRRSNLGAGSVRIGGVHATAADFLDLPTANRDRCSWDLCVWTVERDEGGGRAWHEIGFRLSRLSNFNGCGRPPFLAFGFEAWRQDLN